MCRCFHIYNVLYSHCEPDKITPSYEWRYPPRTLRAGLCLRPGKFARYKPPLHRTGLQTGASQNLPTFTPVKKEAFPHTADPPRGRFPQKKH